MSSGAAPASAPASAPAPPAPSRTSKEVFNDPSRTGFDPETQWWMNYFKILTGQMTPEGQFHYREWRYRVHEERDCKRCEEYRDWLFAYSPVVRFMSEKIGALNGKLDASNIMCRRCPARLQEDGQVHRQSGGFSPNHGILLCANEIRDRKHLEDTLAHEMVHAWDHLRWKVDWVGDKDLKHAACTEVSLTPSILGGLRREGNEWALTNTPKDPCINAQWGVQMVERSIHERQLEAHTTVPTLREDASHQVCHG